MTPRKVLSYMTLRLVRPDPSKEDSEPALRYAITVTLLGLGSWAAARYGLDLDLDALVIIAGPVLAGLLARMKVFSPKTVSHLLEEAHRMKAPVLDDGDGVLPE